MKKWFCYLRGEVKNSVLFLVMLLVVITVTMFLISSSVDIIEQNTTTTRYYNKSLANKYIVDFSSSADDITLDSLRESGLSVDNIATSSVIGSFDGTDVRVITPSAVAKMPKLGFKFAKNLPSDYREMYVNESSAAERGYIKGQYYTLPVDGVDGFGIRVKVKGFFNDATQYYCFRDYANVISNFNDIIICDNLPNTAKIECAVFYDDINPLGLLKAGHRVLLGRDLYNANSYNTVFIYLAFIVALLSITTILINYLISIDSLRKRFAIQYVVGIDYVTIFSAEIFKMATIFLISVVLNSIATAVYTSIDTVEQIVSFKSFGHSVWLIFVIYSLSLFVGMFKLFKVKPLESVTTEIND